MAELLLSPETLALLFAIALLAGTLDTLVGGGGLLCLPALVMVGLPPLYALGTNKLQGTMGTATATLMMHKHGLVSWPQIRLPMLLVFLSAAAGSFLVQQLDVSHLRVLIPFVLLFVAGYFLVSSLLLRQLPTWDLGTGRFNRFVLPWIGLYDGMFGPGTGSFFSLAGVALRKLSLLDATALAKALNFATNLASLLVFVAADHVVWRAGLVMMLGQALGAYLGSRLLLRISAVWLKALIVCICFLMLLRYWLGG